MSVPTAGLGTLLPGEKRGGLADLFWDLNPAGARLTPALMPQKMEATILDLGIMGLLSFTESGSWNCLERASGFLFLLLGQ